MTNGEIWEALQNSQDVSLSAPPSSGKSFMLQNYFINECSHKEKFFGIYIVPTRALISEVSIELKRSLYGKDIKIRTALGIIRDEKRCKKEIFILTPERCLQLFELPNLKEISIDIIFIDEIQKMEDDERGVLLEFIFNELSKLYPKSRIIIAGPYLLNLENLFKKYTNRDSILVKSFLSPIFQLKSSLKFKKFSKSVDITIKSPTGNDIKCNIPLENSLYGVVSNNMGNALIEIVKNFGMNSRNIIYSHRRDMAEKWAGKLSECITFNDNNRIDDQIRDLIEYISQEIHPDYSLITCLRNQVAFHHGSLPELVRLEIEDLFKNEKLQNLVCTTTLLEGVNLPAEKMFIITPKKSNKTLEDFEFGNLIGRTGRVKTSLYGSVYCIHVEDDPWPDEKLTSDFRKEIIPTTSKAFGQYKGDLLNNIQKSFNEFEPEVNKSVKYTIYLLRHKYIKNERELKNYLIEKELNKDEIDEIVTQLSSSLKKMVVPEQIINLNPTIDPLLQNQLYIKMKSEGIFNWMITSHPLAKIQPACFRREYQDRLHFSNKCFYYQFEDILERLDSLFSIEEEINENKNISTSLTLRQVVRYAVPWIQGKSYKYLIENDIATNQRNLEVDRIIRDIIKIINDNVCFSFVKYFKLWSNILKSLMAEEERDKYNYFLNLPNMIEMGCCHPRALELMIEGVNRSIANEIAGNIPNSYEKSSIEWIKSNKQISLSNIYKKHLCYQGIL